MNSFAKSKWFIPIIILLMLLIVIAPTFFGSDVQNSEEISAERKIEELCDSVYGVKDSKVVITYEEAKMVSIFGGEKEQGRIRGIAVLCKGGSNPDIQLKLQELLQALFQIPSTRITICERN